MPMWIFVLALFFWASSSFSITLDEAFQAALQKNETAKQSHEQVIQAEEQLSQARGSIFPNLSFQASHLVQPEPTDPIAREFFPEEQTTANFQLKQPLFRGFREFAGVRQRQRTVNAQEQNRVQTLLSLYESVATSYLNVLSLEQDIKNLKEQKNIYAERIRLLKERVRRGESSTTEALTAQSTEAVLDAEIRIVESQLITARENFKFLTTLPANAVLDDTTLQGKQDFSLRPLRDYLSNLEKRPDIASAREKVEASREEVKIARGGHWPTLDLTGNYYLVRPEGYLSDMKWDVQLQLTFPIYEGGIIQSQTREAASRNRERELELSRLRREAETQITSLHESLRNRSSQLAALQRASELSEKNYQVLQREFRRGLTRSIDVQLALTEFRVARRSYDQARYAAQLDWIRLQIASAQFPSALAKEL